MQIIQMPGGPGGPGFSGGAMAGGEVREGMRRGGRQMSEEDRKKFQDAMQKALGGKKPDELSPEERQKIFAKIRESMGGAFPGGAGRQGGREGREGRREGADGVPEDPGGRPAMQAGTPGAPGGMDFMRMMSAPVGQFSEAELANAKLPPAPEEDSQLDVLLRPGLLADVEIIVEKIPNALHIPAQAVFEKDGKPVVYVQKGKKFEERPILLAKRSESTMVLAGGVNPGETIALADPFAKKGGKKGAEPKKSGGGNPMGAMPAGGGAGEQGGGRRGGR